MKSILIVGSAIDARRIKTWDLTSFSVCVVINNAWQLTDHWDYLIYPDDMPQENLPAADILKETQSLITSREYVSEQNHFGGFIYAGGTMAFTAGYWALGALKPDVIAYVGCDMIYPENNDKKSHFYGKGEADPLRQDITLQSLEAKSARLMALAHMNNCMIVNLSELTQSRLLFPRTPIETFLSKNKSPTVLQEYNVTLDMSVVNNALQEEASLGYMVESGRYWEAEEIFDSAKLSAIDLMWIQSAINL
tara:strand:+ start:400 stop:1149 length:750 start_codon:yes stop_codon:yes gene_type:complete